jgi:PAS domain S-box-containing protein
LQLKIKREISFENNFFYCSKKLIPREALKSLFFRTGFNQTIKTQYMDDFFKSEQLRKTNILINAIWAAVIFMNVTFGIAIFVLPEFITRYLTFIVVSWVAAIILIFLTKKSKIKLSALLYLILFIWLIFGGAWTGGGIRGHGLKLLPIVVLFAGLTLEKKGIWLFTILTSLCGLGLVFAEYYMFLPRLEPLGQDATIHWVYQTTCIFLLAFLAYLAVRDLKKSLRNVQVELAHSKEMEEKYRLILESFPDIYFQTDVEGKIIVVSPSVKACIGYDVVDVVGRNISEFYLDSKAGNAFLVDLKTNEYVRNYELDMVSKEGNVIKTIISSRFIYDENANQIGVEGTIHDITKMQEAKDLLKIHHKELLDIAFLQSHIVRRPVATILGLIRLIDVEDRNNPINFEVIKHLETAAKELDSVIKKIIEKTHRIQEITEKKIE